MRGTERQGMPCLYRSSEVAYYDISVLLIHNLVIFLYFFPILFKDADNSSKTCIAFDKRERRKLMHELETLSSINDRQQ